MDPFKKRFPCSFHHQFTLFRSFGGVTPTWPLWNIHGLLDSPGATWKNLRLGMTGGSQKTYPPEIYRMDTKKYEKNLGCLLKVDAMYLLISVDILLVFFFEKKWPYLKPEPPTVGYPSFWFIQPLVDSGAVPISHPTSEAVRLDVQGGKILCFFRHSSADWPSVSLNLFNLFNLESACLAGFCGNVSTFSRSRMIEDCFFSDDSSMGTILFNRYRFNPTKIAEPSMDL